MAKHIARTARARSPKPRDASFDRVVTAFDSMSQRFGVSQGIIVRVTGRELAEQIRARIERERALVKRLQKRLDALRREALANPPDQNAQFAGRRPSLARAAIDEHDPEPNMLEVFEERVSYELFLCDHLDPNRLYELDQGTLQSSISVSMGDHVSYVRQISPMCAI